MLREAQKRDGITTVRLLNLGTRLELVVNARLRPFYLPGKSPGTYCAGFWMSPQGLLDGYGGERNSCSRLGSNPEPSSQPLYRPRSATYVNCCRELNVTERETSVTLNALK
jgi:hypothetical protein